MCDFTYVRLWETPTIVTRSLSLFAKGQDFNEGPMQIDRGEICRMREMFCILARVVFTQHYKIFTTQPLCT